MNQDHSRTYQFNPVSGRAGAREYRNGKSPPPGPQGRVPRISKLMALAIRFETLIREDVVANQAEIAQLALVSRARVTQIMNLLNLAPEIQEELLLLPKIVRGKDSIHLKGILPIASEMDWNRQREAWQEIVQS